MSFRASELSIPLAYQPVAQPRPTQPPPPAPGEYLRLRRRAAGLSVEQVALMVSSDPHVPAHRRAEWVLDLESGAAELTVDVSLALSAAAMDRSLPFDPRVLADLVLIADGAPVAPPHLCRACGCSHHDACQHDFPRGCSWSVADPYLCTACEAEAAAAPARELAA